MKIRIYLFRIEVSFRRDSRYIGRFGNVLVIAEDMDRVLTRCSGQIRYISGSIAIIVAFYLRFGWAFNGETKGAGLTVCVYCKFSWMADDASVQTWSESPDVGFFVRTYVDLEGRFGNLFAAICDHYYVTAFLNRRVVTFISRSVSFGHSKVIQYNKSLIKSVIKFKAKSRTKYSDTHSISYLSFFSKFKCNFYNFIYNTIQLY